MRVGKPAGENPEAVIPDERKSVRKGGKDSRLESRFAEEARNLPREITS